ncbi:MAG: tRNA glutamyl-Q(34) synthetase GluQRS [Pseudomonadota bacterium]
MRHHHVGRFAPSPSGPLHSGSVVTALASWLDARAHGGRWLVRIEDVDAQRCDPIWVPVILAQLARLGLQPDEPPVWQSQRGAAYQAAVDTLQARSQVYACDCSRKAIRLAWAGLANPSRPAGAAPDEADGELPYPGTCRDRGLPIQVGTALRVRAGTLDAPVHLQWQDRRLGLQTQNLSRAVGDFILRRRDGLWAYQLAVVIDDAAQGITDVVRGEDLSGNTARQIHLQHLLGLPTPRYWHGPLVLDAQGRKLSKHIGAPTVLLDTPEAPRAALSQAAEVLGLNLPADHWQAGSLEDGLHAALKAWQVRWLTVA